MSMKHILGMMLASRMAGRGARRGSGSGGGFGGGLGGLAAAGMLGGRKGGLGRKAGLAALGYMAWRAYQDHQARAGAPASRVGGAAGGTAGPGQTSASPSGSGGSGGLGDALGGIVKSLGGALSGGQAHPAPAQGGGASFMPAFAPEDEQAAESFDEATALLLVRAMVAAASADGAISADERARIMTRLDEAGADAEDRRELERELASPRPVEDLLGQVRGHEMAEQFYLASRMAIDATTPANGAYLARLRERLGIAEDEAAELNTAAD